MNTNMIYGQNVLLHMTRERELNSQCAGQHMEKNILGIKDICWNWRQLLGLGALCAWNEVCSLKESVFSLIQKQQFATSQTFRNDSDDESSSSLIAF